MQRQSRWLVGLIIASLLLPVSALAEGLSGSVEIGGAAVGITDDGSIVNEYASGRANDGATAIGAIDLEGQVQGLAVELAGEINGPHDQKMGTSFNLNRMFRGFYNYSVMMHQLDHDRLNYMDAAVVRGGMNKTTHLPVDLSTTPAGTVTPDLVPAFVLHDPDSSTGNIYWGSDTGDFSSLILGGDERVIQTGGASVYAEDLTSDADFSVTRRKRETGLEMVVAPGVTLDVGYAHETRKGTEQAIGMSKCASCHVTGGAKEINEKTTDVKAGLSGQFGMLTMRYDLTDRVFENNSVAPEYVYDPVTKPGTVYTDKTFDNRMIYDADTGPLPYDSAPDSKKRTNLLKARLDLANNTNMVGSYVSSKAESNKSNGAGYTASQSKLTTRYDGYGLKAATRMGAFKLLAHARITEVKGEDNTVNFTPITSPGAPAAGITFPATSTSSTLESEASRDKLEVGFDVVWKLVKKTSLRFGYDYATDDRENAELGETTTQTYQLKLNSRPLKRVAVRAGYTYQDIDNPFHNPDAALVPLTSSRLQAKFGVPGYIVGADSDLYGSQYYDARIAELSNQPDSVHELKLNTTWSPSAQFSVTLAIRYAMEENTLSHSTWEQDTFMPTLSLWYAPQNGLSLTTAYNYFDQRSKTAFCQGFYDG